jgi:hypothetical protein
MPGVLVSPAAATYHHVPVCRSPVYCPQLFRACACSRDVPVRRPSFCEVEVNHTLIVPEFDPESQPIGYSLALEFSGEGGYADSPEE